MTFVPKEELDRTLVEKMIEKLGCLSEMKTAKEYVKLLQRIANLLDSKED